MTTDREMEAKRRRVLGEVEESERRAAEALERGDLPERLRDPNGFFAFHYRDFLKTPPPQE